MTIDWVNGYCLNATQQLFSHIMASTSYISDDMN